jgi:hypothetical protein
MDAQSASNFTDLIGDPKSAEWNSLIHACGRQMQVGDRFQNAK